ncbi:MAG: cobalamin-binding protein [Gemmataceae bacterium]
MRQLRVVSLLAAGTEIVSALGMRHTLVGRSHECDYPPDVLSLPVCSRPRIEVQATSRAIDQQIRACRATGQPVFELDAALIQRLKPDVVITQAHCQVCAVSATDVQIHLADALCPGCRVVTLQPRCLAEVWQDIQRVAAALEVPKRGERLVGELQTRLDRLRAAVAARSTRPRTVLLEWLDPLMGAGSWLPELIELAGGEPIWAHPGGPPPTGSLDQLRYLAPDVLVAAPCGYSLDRTRPEFATLCSHPGLREVPAIRQRRLYLADGNQYFNRSGPRLVDSAEILAEILSADECLGPYRGQAWEVLR